VPSIAIDFTPAYEQTAGIGRLVRQMVSTLLHQDQEYQYHLFIAGVKSSKPLPTFANIPVHSTQIPPIWLARLWHRLKLPLPIEVFTGKHTLFHATDFVLPPTLPNTKTILTVHDLTFVRVPNAASPNLKKYLDFVVPKSIQRANHIIADSQATKDDIIQIYDCPPDKIDVVLSGVDERFKPTTNHTNLRDKYKIGTRPFILSVGTVQPRKNYSRVIQALALLRSQGYEIDYVIAGGKGWLQEEMYQTINTTKMTDYVHLIGFADDEDLPALYSESVCVLTPSLYEGFGLPVLEALACGVPVITSNISSLPEVAGTVGILVNPNNTEDITSQLKRVLDDTALRQDLSLRGIKHAKNFTWQNSAMQLKNVYKKVLERG
jgi:glycosyltransferase involved in cell wall biosynthesis